MEIVLLIILLTITTILSSQPPEFYSDYITFEKIKRMRERSYNDILNEKLEDKRFKLNLKKEILKLKIKILK